MTKINLKDRYFGRLRVVSFSHSEKSYQRSILFWNVECECGKTKVVRGNDLRQGRITSCGSCNKITHGHTINGASKEYHAWQDAKNRCYNPKVPSYSYCGARGIRMCERWLKSFNDFLTDMGAAPIGSTLERKNNEGNYEPNNCWWATPRDQANNRRTNLFYTKPE